MSQPVICMDFDGTLVDSRGRIHPRDVEILAGERRPVFIPSTGRPLRSIRRVLERHGLFADQCIPFPLVLMNGSAVYEADEIVHAMYAFPPDVQAALVDAALAHPQVTCFWLTPAEVLVLWPAPFGAQMARRFDLDTQPFILNGHGQLFGKLMCLAENSDLIEALAADIAGLAVERYYSLPTVLEINPAGVQKGRSTLALLADLGLDHSDLAVAGDGENDLPLFELAACSFAANTSPPAIQARAGHIVNVAKTGLLAPILEAIGLR